MPVATVINRSRPLVIKAETGCSKFVSKRKSRFVKIPTSSRPLVTGTPEIRYCSIKSSAFCSGSSGSTVIGSEIIPLSERLTIFT